jgi:hypothetical protein
MQKKRLLVVTLFTLASVACEPALEAARRVTLADDVASRTIVGISRDAEGDALQLLTVDEGTARVDTDGELIDENTYGANGLLQDAYRDLAVDDDGTIFLLADNEGFRFNAERLEFEQHFCVLPGDDLSSDMPIAPGESPPEPWQENDALTLVDDTLIAAPRFFDGRRTAPNEALLSSYNKSDGEPTGVVNITALGLNILALAATSADIYALAGGDLHVFSRQGDYRGEIEIGSMVTDPQAMTLVGDELVFLDGDELVFVALESIEGHINSPL